MNQYETNVLEIAISKLKGFLGEDVQDFTLKSYENLFFKILEFSCTFDGTVRELIKSFYELSYEVPAFIRPKQPNYRKSSGIVIKLYGLVEGQSISKKSKYFAFGLSNTWWALLLGEYTHWLEERYYSEYSKETRLKHIKTFFYFLTSETVYCVDEITNKKIEAYLKYMNSKGLASSSKSSYMSSLRIFFEFLSEKKMLKEPISSFIASFSFSKRERLPSFYTSNEVKRAIENINRTTKQGKLLYCVILLAAVYGIRSVDVRNLTFSNIYWDRNIIAFTQHKTHNSIELPLIHEVRYALLDYLKNARPEVSEPTLFICNRAPHTKYSSFSSMVRRLFINSGIEISNRHCGLHALRHSLATMLSSMDIPINQIADILGHSTAQATLTYIWSDVEHLRVVSEEVPYV